VLRKAGGSSNIRKILPLWGGPHGRSPWAVPRIAAALVGHLGGTAGGVRPTTQAISMKRTNAVAATLCALVLAAAALYSQAQTGAAHVVVDVSQRFQLMDGLGVNFNGTYFRDSQKPVIDMLIDDLGATIFRLDPYGLSNW